MRKQLSDVLSQGCLTGPYVCERIYELTNGEAIISTDVGQHQMWAAQYYKYKNQDSLLHPAVLVRWDMVLVLHWCKGRMPGQNSYQHCRRWLFPNEHE